MAADPLRLPYFIDKDDPLVVEKAQANLDAAAAHYAERERLLRERITTLRDRDCPYLGSYKLGYDSALDDVLGALDGR